MEDEDLAIVHSQGMIYEQKLLNEGMLTEGDIRVENAAVLPFLRPPLRGEGCYRPFRLPAGVAPRDPSVRFTLGCKRRPLGSALRPFKRPVGPSPEFVIPMEDVEANAASLGDATPASSAPKLPEGYTPLVLYEPPEGVEGGSRVVVDDCIGQFLRVHQREGVSFMFECIHGLRGFEGAGCILADDMGLGKTLQSIALLWTVLRQGLVVGKPTARRVIVVCPTSLVNNWAKEIVKWLGSERVKPLALAEVTRDEAVRDIGTFLSSRTYPVLIISYETFRIHSKRFHGREDSCDLLICDEAHRLKNDATLTNKALAALQCRRRILLSGTPMQNDLDEFFAMADFTNPGLLGDNAAFRRLYSTPILTGREPTATDREKSRGEEAGAALSNIVNRFILRRTNTLLSAHLPPKRVQVVCVRLHPLQRALYTHFLQSKNVAALLAGKSTGVLSSITALRKLINHPKLIADVIRVRQAAGAGARGGGEAAGWDDCTHLFPPAMFTDRNSVFSELGGKFSLCARMLEKMRAVTPVTARERIVIVSVFTQTLDLFSALCKQEGYPCIRLDGSTGPGKRQKMVDAFNDPGRDEFVFLLSSKAGGCGLNLIGGNRLILFDPDWNPATDLQAAARVWRDGQRRRVYVYRFLAAGTLEEKVFQRQLSKKGLQTVVVEEGEEVNDLSTEDLRNLFSPLSDTPSDTHDTLRCARCRKNEIEVGESEDELEGVKIAERARRGGAAALAAAALSTSSEYPSCSLAKEGNPGDSTTVTEKNDAVKKVSTSALDSMAINGDEENADCAGIDGGCEEGGVTPLQKNAAVFEKEAVKEENEGGGGVETEVEVEEEEEEEGDDDEVVIISKKMRPSKGKNNERVGRKHDSAAAEKRAAIEEKKREKAFSERFAAQMKNELGKALPPVPVGVHRRQLKFPGEDDLKNWSHHMELAGVGDSDSLLTDVGGGLVSWVFGLEVPGRDLVELNAALDAKERERAEREASEALAKRMAGGDGKRNMYMGGGSANRFPFAGGKLGGVMGGGGAAILASLNLNGSSSSLVGGGVSRGAPPPPRALSTRNRISSALTQKRPSLVEGSDEEEEEEQEEEEEEEDAEQEAGSDSDDDKEEENLVCTRYAGAALKGSDKNPRFNSEISPPVSRQTFSRFVDG